MKRLIFLALFLCLPSLAYAQGGTGFFLVGPGQQWANCVNIPNPQVNLTWCGDGNNSPNYTWRVWDGAAYVAIGGGGGGAGIISLNAQTGAAFPNQFFGNDANITITSSGGVHTLGMAGCVPVSRGGIGICSGTANALPYFDTPSSVAMSGITWTAPNILGLGPLTWTLVDGTAGQVLTTDGAGVLSFTAAGTGTVTGSGTAGTLPIWVSATALGDSHALDDGSDVFTIVYGGDTHFVVDQNGPFWVHGLNNDTSMASGVVGVWGYNNTVDNSASDSYAFGEGNQVSGNDSQSFGEFNTVSGNSSTAVGRNNTLTGSDSYAFGEQLDDGGNSDTIVIGEFVVAPTQGLHLGVSTAPEVSITGSQVQIGQIGSPTTILKFAGSTSGSTSLKAAATPTPTTFALPTADGSNGDCLVTDGAGQLTFSNTCAGGAGITSLNGLAAAVQTVAAGSTNINWSSAVSTHTFTWTGTLLENRGGTNKDTSAWSALPLVTAGVWSQFAGSTCGGGQSATAISASGVLTCAATGTGNVTHTGTLTLGQPVVGNGGADVKVLNATAEGVLFATTSGVMAQDTTAFNYDPAKHTLKLGFSGAFATAPWGSPPLMVSTNAEIASATGSLGPSLFLQSSNGTLAAPTATINTDRVGSIDFRGFDGTNAVVGARIAAIVSGPLSLGVMPTGLKLQTADSGGLHDTLTLRSNGNVVLGHKLVGYNGFGATNGALLIGNGTGGAWDANTLTAGPGISITNGPGTIQISTTGSPGNCAGGGRVVLTDAATDAVVTFGAPMATATYAMASSVIPGAGAVVGIPVYVKDVTVNGFTVVLSAAPGAGKSTTVAWIATPSTCIF